MSLSTKDLEQVAWYLNNDTSRMPAYLPSRNIDQLWQLICGFLVFYMHAGFACLEAGAVRSKNTINILFKNFMTVSIGAIMYFLLGWGFAYGKENVDNDSIRFIGNGDYALDDSTDAKAAEWFFQMVFAATAATIVSGAVAERTKLPAYMYMAAWLSAFVYPIVSHWGWATGGWASHYRSPPLFYDGGDNPEACGLIDFAGSAIVHLTGGVAGFVGAWMVGPRKGRFEIKEDGRLGKAHPLPGHNLGLSAIGTFILWFGWYGFNCGSTLSFSGSQGDLAGHVAVTTSISASSAAITGAMVHFALTGSWDLGIVMNCILAGLVSITAGCAVVDEWMAIFIGMIGALVYFGGSKFMKVVHVDDPLDAVAVHGFGGIWGTLAVGIFATEDLVARYYECDGGGNNTGIQFATQLVFVLAVIAWVGATSLFGFGLLHLTLGIRVSEQVEEDGLDASEHGAVAYELAMFDNDMREQREPFVKHHTAKNTGMKGSSADDGKAGAGSAAGTAPGTAAGSAAGQKDPEAPAATGEEEGILMQS